MNAQKKLGVDTSNALLRVHAVMGDRVKGFPARMIVSQKTRRSLIKTGLLKVLVRGTSWDNGLDVITPKGRQRALELSARIALAQ